MAKSYEDDTEVILNSLDEYFERARHLLRMSKLSKKRIGRWDQSCNATFSHGKAYMPPALHIETRWDSTWMMLFELGKNI
eukprot:snap_masked-scaffold_7-processed-gene-0.12-mRNA-1 protein AED:1.00 eAED:1.00 QI:0/0/0/0/1/1/2/0/79